MSVPLENPGRKRFSTTMSQSSDDAKGQAADGGVPAVSPDKAICAEAEQAATLYAAEEVFNHILGRVKAFQAQLPEDHELGLQLADMGAGQALHVRGMSYKNPNIIEFSGMLNGAQQVLIIQHISQLSFLLIAVPPPADQKPYRIGFGADL